MIRNDHASESIVTVNGPMGNGVNNQNGNAISISTDSTPSPISKPPGDEVDSPPRSPTSALRKSGERRSNSHARVTFEDTQTEPQDAIDLERHETPRRRSRDRTPQSTPNRKRKRKQQDGEKRNSRDSTPVGAIAGSNDKSLFGDFPLQETPENTLTRNYRHSI